jgi:hypothetical protein
MSDLIEIASTGRSKCRRCQQKIDKGGLRFGEKVPNAFGEGEATHWFHLACAAEKRPEKVGVALASFEPEIPDRERIAAIAAEGSENPKLAAIVRAERAPSGRATCQQCHEKIAKDELRIAFERDAEPMGMASTASIHVGCGPAYFGSAGLLAKLERSSPELSADELSALRAALG